MNRWLGWLRRGALYAAAWSPLVVVYLVVIASGNPMRIVEALGASLRSVGAAALLGLGVVAAARRWSWPPRAALPFVAGHLAGAALYGLAWLGAIVLQLVRVQDGWRAVVGYLEGWWGWQALFGSLLYFAIAGITWAQVAVARARDREARLAEAEALRVKAELGALRGQLDPHFLFNTLHTVSVLARHDPPAAARAVERLAALLRYVLDTNRGAREEVPLADELAFVDAYLELEALRFGDRLRVERAVAPEALGRPVPSLALQPLVENALRHGVAPRPEGGTVRVAGRVEGGVLVLEVADDGPGAAGGADRPKGFGVGLDALRRRLRARYGDAARLDVRTAPGAGFAVTITVPT